MPKSTLLFFFLIMWQAVSAQESNPYHLALIGSRSEYVRTVQADSNNRLVEIKKYIPGIRLDIRYATTNNFTGKRMYDQPRAFARLPVVKALKKVQDELNKQGLGLKIFDGYRPYAITRKFYEAASDKSFVADPKKGSRHNRGCAIDLTLVTRKTGTEIAMPTPYDSFSPKADPAYPDLPANIVQNRDLLIHTMEKYGFKVIENEWWHFDFNGWSNFSLMDIRFNEI